MKNISLLYNDVYGGIYTTIAGGFKVKKFSFISGFLAKSLVSGLFFGLEIKVGYTI